MNFIKHLLGLAVLVCALAVNAQTAQTPTPAQTLEQANQLLVTGKPAEALALVNKALASTPRDAQFRFLKGVLLAQMGQSTEAEQVYTEMTRDFPELPEPYNNLAVLYSAQNQPDRARAALEMAIRNNPAYATAHENLGDVYLQLAKRAFEKAIELDPSNPNPKNKRLKVESALARSP